MYLLLQAALLGQLLEKVLSARRAKQYDSKSMELSAKLLELNPEIYTVWNYRREGLGPTVDAGGEIAVETIAAELKLTERALLRNPKSYSTWHHRKWAVEKNFSSLEHELMLVEKLLDADCRNFHGWGYRLHIACRMGLPVQRELDFARHKIEQNFSNYSAWHYRSVMLPLAFKGSGQNKIESCFDTTVCKGNDEDPLLSSEDCLKCLHGSTVSSDIPPNVLRDEFDFVKQAFYTEPEDQSAWFYHRWLIGCCIARYHVEISSFKDMEETGIDKRDEYNALIQSEFLDTLRSQQQVCEEVIELEPESKWALLTLAGLKELENTVLDGNKSDENRLILNSVQEMYTKLSKIDRMRKGFYEDRAAGKADIVPGLRRSVSTQELF